MLRSQFDAVRGQRLSKLVYHTMREQVLEPELAQEDPPLSEVLDMALNRIRRKGARGPRS